MLTPNWSHHTVSRILPPSPADAKAMAVYHDSEYLDFILSPYNFSERLAGDLRHTEFGIEDVRVQGS